MYAYDDCKKNEAVCRSAPATLGLIKIKRVLREFKKICFVNFYQTWAIPSKTKQKVYYKICSNIFTQKHQPIHRLLGEYSDCIIKTFRSVQE